MDTGWECQPVITCHDGYCLRLSQLRWRVGQYHMERLVMTGVYGTRYDYPFHAVMCMTQWSVWASCITCGYSLPTHSLGQHTSQHVGLPTRGVNTIGRLSIYDATAQMVFPTSRYAQHMSVPQVNTGGMFTYGI